MEKLQHIKITGSVFPVLVGDPDIIDMDWNNPDVRCLFEHMKSRMEKIEKRKPATAKRKRVAKDAARTATVDSGRIWIRTGSSEGGM